MSDKLTMREALTRLLNAVESTEREWGRAINILVRAACTEARAALAAEEESGWRAIEITGLSVLDDGRAEARFAAGSIALARGSAEIAEPCVPRAPSRRR